MTVAQQFKNAIDLLEFIKTHPKLDKSHPKYTGKLVIGIESRSLKKEQKDTWKFISDNNKMFMEICELMGLKTEDFCLYINHNVFIS